MGRGADGRQAATDGRAATGSWAVSSGRPVTGRRAVKSRGSLVGALAGALAAVLVLAGCGDGQVRRNDNGDQAGYISGDGAIGVYEPAERQQAPEFGGTLLDGGEFDLASTEGEVVVLNVWGSWCPPCRKEAPDLQSAFESLTDQGVQFVGVNLRDTERAAQAFEDEFGITYPSVFDPKGKALLAFRDTVPPQTFPSTLVIDREGRIAVRILGPIGETSLRDIVSDIAAEDETAAAGS